MRGWLGCNIHIWRAVEVAVQNPAAAFRTIHPFKLKGERTI